MKTDRELLELAAKAAGYKDWVDFSPVVGEPALSIRANGGPGMWTPLTDDGDALRLAVKLRIRIDYIGIGYAHISYDKRVSEFFDDGGYEIANFDIYEQSTEKQGNDALVRRAIVRAAAAIGEVME